MPEIDGIKTKKDAQGNIYEVTIDISKFEEDMVPFLQKVGVMENEKEKFEREWNDPDNLTIEDARMLSHKHIDELWDGRKK
jgi:hypothetical protein